MNKTKKIAFISILPIFVLVLSGCGQQAVPQTSTTPPTTQGIKTAPPVQNQTPANNSTQTIPPLPADNKTAIDSETQGIQADLDSIDTSLSKDTTDTSLGL